jgi:hypothetical protein
MSITWDATFETKPLDTSPDFIATTDDYLREYKSAFRERFSKEHVFDLVNQDTQGVHREGVSRLVRNTTAPALPGDKAEHAGLLWQDTGTTFPGIYYGSYNEASEETLFKRASSRWRVIGDSSTGTSTFTPADIYSALNEVIPYDSNYVDGSEYQPFVHLHGAYTAIQHDDSDGTRYHYFTVVGAQRYSSTEMVLYYLAGQYYFSKRVYYRYNLFTRLRIQEPYSNQLTISASLASPTYTGSIIYKERPQR